MGRDLLALYPQGTMATLRSDLSLLAEGSAQELRGTWTGRRKDGSQVRVDARTLPVRSDDGLLLGYVGFADEAGSGVAAEDGVRRRDRLADCSRVGVDSRRALDSGRAGAGLLDATGNDFHARHLLRLLPARADV